jgi:tRNA(fMet)-specific endonuclease VapC
VNLQDTAAINRPVRGELLQRGLHVAKADLVIASVALYHNLTLVTHNAGDFQNIPGLPLDDWPVQ